MKILTAADYRAAPDWFGGAAIAAPLSRGRERMAEAIIARPQSITRQGQVRQFTPQEDAVIRRLNALRCPISQVAEVLTRSRQSIRARSKLIGEEFTGGTRRVRLAEAVVRDAMAERA